MAEPDISAARPRFRLPFATLLALLLAVLTGLPLLVVFVVAFGSGVRNTQELLADKSRLAVTTLVRRTEDYLAPAQAAAGFLGEQMVRGRLNPHDATAIERAIRYAIVAAPQLNGLAFAHPDGWTVAAYRVAAGDIATERGLWLHDPVVGPAVRDSAGRDAPYWGRPIYIDGARTTMVTYVVPARRDGRPLGAVAATIRLETLSAFIAELGQDLAETSFILLGQSHVIAHRRLASGDMRFTAEAPLPTLTEIGDPVLQAMWSADGGRTPDAAAGWTKLPGEALGRQVEVGGSRYAVLYRPLDLPSLDQPWLVGAYLPAASAMAEIRRLALAAIASVVALAATLLAAVVIGRRLREPVDELGRLAHAVSRLETDRLSMPMRSRIIELDDAIDALARSATALRLFARFVPRRVVEIALSQGEAEVLRSRARIVTVMFTDMVGFSQVAAGMSAEACAAFLNHHLSLLTGCIEAEHGVVDKFIGDAVMAVWIDAEPDAGAQAAARAALTIRAALHADNAVRQPPVRVRVGLHTGKVVIGSLGSPTRLNFTVVGEAVNVAQRIEALGKLVAADAEVAILASAHTAALLADGFRLRPVGPHRLPGHDEPIQVVAIDGMIASGAGRGSWPVAATGASR